MSDPIADLFAPFLLDAAETAGVKFSIWVDVDDEDGLAVVWVAAPDASRDGFSFDPDGDRDSHLEQAMECFDVLQESVHDYLAEAHGRFGPWPPCPITGHTHKLTVHPHPEALVPWWKCREGTFVTEVGHLNARRNGSSVSPDRSTDAANDRSEGLQAPPTP